MGYVEAAVGWDDNTNLASSDSEFSVGGGTLTLSDDSLAQEEFAWWGIGYYHPSLQTAAYARLDGAQHNNTGSRDFDTRVTTGQLGVLEEVAWLRCQCTGDFQDLHLNGDDYRQLYGVAGQLGGTLNKFSSYDLGSSLLQSDYQDETYDHKDAVEYAFSAGYNRQWRLPRCCVRKYALDTPYLIRMIKSVTRKRRAILSV